MPISSPRKRGLHRCPFFDLKGGANINPNDREETLERIDPFVTDDPGSTPGEGKEPPMATDTAVRARVKDAVEKAETTPAYTGTGQRIRAKQFAPQGDFTPMANLDGVELDLHSIEDTTTVHGPALLLRVTEVEGENIGLQHLVFTSSEPLMPALNAVRAAVEAKELQYPVAVKFVKVTGAKNAYWTIE